METWQDVFKVVIMLVVGFAGAPVTQLFKNLLSTLLKKAVEDRWALLLTGLVAGGFALLEMWLSGALVWSDIGVSNFPQAFFGTFTLATLYYGWLKNSESLLGSGGLLKRSSNNSG
jgi:hypothetical protein